MKTMKTKSDVQPLIEKIADPKSPVGMDAVYVHALILDKLQEIERRLEALESQFNREAQTSAKAKDETM